MKKSFCEKQYEKALKWLGKANNILYGIEKTLPSKTLVFGSVLDRAEFIKHCKTWRKTGQKPPDIDLFIDADLADYGIYCDRGWEEINPDDFSAFVPMMHWDGIADIFARSEDCVIQLRHNRDWAEEIEDMAEEFGWSEQQLKKQLEENVWKEYPFVPLGLWEDGKPDWEFMAAVTKSARETGKTLTDFISILAHRSTSHLQ